MILINPKKKGIDSDSRLVIYDMNLKKFDRIEMIYSGDFYEVDDDYILDNLADFKYKLQIKSQGKWVDETKYLKLYDDKILDRLFNDDLHLSIDELTILLEKYWSKYSVNHLPEIRTAFANSMRNLWNNPYKTHNNLTNVVEISKSAQIEIPLLWKNIIFYIEEIIDLNKFFKNLGISEIFFKDINNGSCVIDERLIKYFNSRIYELEYNELEFSKLFIGLYYSFMGKRNRAIKYFNKAHSYKEKFIEKMKIDIGSYTYLDSEQDIVYNPKISFHTPLRPEKTNVTILLSMDSKFLRIYGVQLFYSVIALRNYHFHLHIVDDNNTSEKSIKESQKVFNDIMSFMKPENTIISPSFSSEICPNFVKDPKTYYACSRYVIAKDIMKYNKNDIFIMDADFFIHDELDSYISNLSKYDISIPFSQALLSLFPWRRIMAGYVFLKNNSRSHEFIGLVKKYIVNNLDKDNSWTLDQNALSYAYENIYDLYSDIRIGNSNEYYTPMSQPALRKLIEKVS